MTIKELLRESIDCLEGIDLKGGELNRIGVPVARSIQLQHALADFFEAQDQQAAQAQEAAQASAEEEEQDADDQNQ